MGKNTTFHFKAEAECNLLEANMKWQLNSIHELSTVHIIQSGDNMKSCDKFVRAWRGICHGCPLAENDSKMVQISEIEK